jgi:hypothetical protein
MTFARPRFGGAMELWAEGHITSIRRSLIKFTECNAIIQTVFLVEGLPDLLQAVTARAPKPENTKI